MTFLSKAQLLISLVLVTQALSLSIPAARNMNIVPAVTEVEEPAPAQELHFDPIDNCFLSCYMCISVSTLLQGGNFH